MPFFLTRWAVGRHQSLPLLDSEYEALSHARAQLTVTLGIEEKFELLVSNYEEMEQDLLRLALNHMVHPDLSWSQMVSDRLQLARRLSNLLSAARLYTDQVKHDLSQHYGREASNDFTGRLAAEYDTSLAFRVVEALRNYIQHRNIPITGISYPCTWLGDEPNNWLRFGLTLSLDVDTLVTDSGFKSSVATEIAAAPKDALDLVLFVRQYVEAIARVHAALRERIREDVQRADQLYRAAADRWRAVGEADIIGLTVVEHRPEAEFPESRFPVTLNLTERRHELAARNQMFDKLSRRFTSGAPRSSGR